MTIEVRRDEDEKLSIKMSGWMAWTSGPFSIAIHHVYARSELDSIRDTTKYGEYEDDLKMGEWRIVYGKGIRMRKSMSDSSLTVSPPIGLRETSSTEIIQNTEANSFCDTR